MNKLYLKYRDKSLIIGEQFVVSGGNFLSGVLIAKALGLEIYSIFATIQIIQLFFGGFHQAFIIAPLTSIYPGLKANKKLFLSTLIIIHIAFIGILTSVAACINLLNYELLKTSIPLVLLYITLILTYDVIRKVLFIHNNNLALIIMNIIAYILPIGILLFDANNLTAILWSYSACISLSIIIGVYLKRKLITPLSFQVYSFKIIWNFAKWLLAKSMVQWFSGNYFIIVAGIVMGKNSIGVIRIIQNLFGLFNVILMVCENYLSVASAKIRADHGASKLREYQKTLFLKLGIGVGFILIVISFLSPTILSLVYGKEYEHYYYLVIAFSVLYFFIFINLSPRFLLRASLITKPLFFSYVISAFFGLISAYYLIEKLELLGVVVGLIGSQILILVWNKRAVKRLIA